MSGGLPRGKDGSFLKKAATTNEQNLNSPASIAEGSGQSEKPRDRGKKHKANFDTDTDEDEIENENEPPEKKARVAALQSEPTVDIGGEEVLPSSAEGTIDNNTRALVQGMVNAFAKHLKPTNFLDLPPELRL